MVSLTNFSNSASTLGENPLFINTKDEWVEKTAKTVDKASELLKAGFDYVTEIDVLKLFRKRK